MRSTVRARRPARQSAVSWPDSSADRRKERRRSCVLLTGRYGNLRTEFGVSRGAAAGGRGQLGRYDRIPRRAGGGRVLSRGRAARDRVAARAGGGPGGDRGG